MRQLTEHFADHELGVEDAPSNVVVNETVLCITILEPVRAKFGPVQVHDGYRDPDHNASVGGKPTSFHMCVGGNAAADISVAGTSNQALFDWLRLESELPFDKVILESNSAGVPVCVHIQIDRILGNRRKAYTGHTGAATAYTEVEVK